MLATSDMPVKSIENDYFGLKKYVLGMAAFAKNCDTPTTIAVQGDWGSGKTSMLNMVREELGDQVLSIWFNTWQFSKFSMDDKLPLSLLSNLNMALEKAAPEHDDKENKLKDMLEVLKKSSVRIASYAIDFLGAQNFATDIAAYGEGSSVQEQDVVEALSSLKEIFQGKIDRIYEKTGKRIVVFIDDLDRLEPARAVELMEVLKLFLDCEHCVYILAIDYGVVSRGICDKYGEEFGLKQGKKFFDKIIQVPFFIPVEKYNIDQYLKQSMQSMNIQLGEENLEEYKLLIQNSVGTNPRSMKRLFNAYLLLSMIYEGEELEKDELQQKLLFCSLCLQMSMEPLYRHLVENLEDLSSFPFEDILNAEDTEHADVLKSEFSEITFEEQDFEMEQAFLFLQQMCRMIADSQNKVIEKNVEKMIKVFNISSSTNGERIRKKTAAPVLTDNLTMEKTIGTTDIKYKILTAGANFHVGFGEQVTMIAAGKEYACKMHSKTKGRIDGLTEFYKDTALEKGDVCVLDYDIAQKRIVCTIKKKG